MQRTTSKRQQRNEGELEFDLGFSAVRELPVVTKPPPRLHGTQEFAEHVRQFKEFGLASRETATVYRTPAGKEAEAPTFINEFWTARQRQASSLHEVSYRACFKPQLPRFFIERLTRSGETVYDPFMGRGTTPLEAALMGRVPLGNDVNPLSLVLTGARLLPPMPAEIEERLRHIPLDKPADTPEDLLAFYHPKTLEGLSSLKRYFLDRSAEGKLDAVDDWLRLVSLNRLTGHSPGFFSVYTLPPNQATSPKAQRRINERRNQTPPERDIRKIILKKSQQLLGDVTAEIRATLAAVATGRRLMNRPAHDTHELPSNSVALVVTSPPFLNVVQYDTDNWLRCWFLGIDAKSVKLTMPGNLSTWEAAMREVFRELERVLQPNGHIAFEVGEVNQGMIQLEKSVLTCGVSAGLDPVLVLINDQKFTKTANCWGIDNMDKGTNTNRIVLFCKRR